MARAGRRRPRRWIALLVVAALLVPTLDSYVGALTARGTDSFGIRSTEWMRAHHFRWLVNDVENFYYSHHQPKRGGAPTGELAKQLRGGAGHVGAGRSAPGNSGSAGSVPGVSAPVPATLTPPSPIQPFVTNPQPGEGTWSTLAQVNGQPAIMAAYLRPDAVHTSLVTGVAWLNPKLLSAVGYAGIDEPGGTWTHQAPIADALRPNLVAAFNSGFKMTDSLGGYYADGRLARPMRVGAATAWIDTGGNLHVGQWGRDVNQTPNVTFARQNLSLLVDAGQPVPDALTGSSGKWGQTVGNKLLVWRSGLGERADGSIVYAAGSGLSVGTLAQTLTRAGAVRAMELDINSAWTTFFTYGAAPAGDPPAALTVTRLVANMQPSTQNYLTASSRDFFALFRR